MEDKVDTNRFSQQRPRKSNDRNNSLEKFLLRLKKQPLSSGKITFKTHIQEFLSLKAHPYERHVPVALHMEVTPGT